MRSDAPGARSSTRVHSCEQNDLREIQEILERAPEAAGWSEGALAKRLESDPEHFLASWQVEGMVGFIVGRAMADEGEILNLAVKPECRRRGAGRELVQALMEVFAREGVTRVFLEVRESNAGAIALYEQLGFQRAGRRQRYYEQPDEAALVLEARIG